jgi:hypothetical protein
MRGESDPRSGPRRRETSRLIDRTGRVLREDEGRPIGESSAVSAVQGLCSTDRARRVVDEENVAE